MSEQDISTEKKGRILIIDDNSRNVQLVATILDHYKYDVEYALDALNGIERLEKGGIDLVLLDIMMPGMDGFEACQAIKKRPLLIDIPILFVTAKNDKVSINKAFKVGGEDYIVKPFDAKELISRVNVHVDLKKNKEKLKDSNKELAQKVEARTQEIQKANAALERLNQELKSANRELVSADQTKHKFLSILGHEIGDALNEAIGMLQILKHRVESRKDAHVVEKIDTSLIKLETFIKSALRITALQSKHMKLKIERFDLNQIIGFCLLNLDDKLRNNSIRLRGQHLDKEMLINGEHHLLSGALLALFDFLVTHSEQKSILQVETIKREEEVRLIIEIDDIQLKKHIKEKEATLSTNSQTGISFDSLEFVKMIILEHGASLTFDFRSNEKITCTLIFTEPQSQLIIDPNYLTELN